MDIQKEKELFLDARQEFIDINQALTSVALPPEILGMPQRFDQLFQKKPMGKVSKLKEFVKIFLSLIQDKYAVV